MSEFKPNIKFDSLADLVDYARGADTCPNAMAMPRYSVEGNTKFCGVPLAQAFDLATHGWPEGAARIKAILDAAPDRPARKKRIQWTPGTSGGPVDIGRYLQGRPDCFNRPVYSAPARGQRIIKIAITNYNCGWDISKIWNRGVAACALIDRLENDGYRVEVIYCLSDYERSHTKQFQMECIIKNAQEPLNLEQMIFCCANNAMHRRIAWAACERMDNATRKTFGYYDPGYYGRSVSPLGDFDLIIDGTNSNPNEGDWLSQLGIQEAA